MADETEAYDASFGDAEQGPADSGPELAVRAGFATAGGQLTETLRIREAVSGVVPVLVDVGYRTKQWFFGAYGQWAYGVTSNTSSSACESCTHSWVRFGLQCQYVLHQTPNHDLWVGLGAGQQWLNTDIGQERRETLQVVGWEYASLHFGSGWRLASGISLGPFSMVSLGSYTKSVRRCQSRSGCAVGRENQEMQLDGLGLHIWFMTGARITFLP